MLRLRQHPAKCTMYDKKSWKVNGENSYRLWTIDKELTQAMNHEHNLFQRLKAYSNQHPVTNDEP